MENLFPMMLVAILFELRRWCRRVELRLIVVLVVVLLSTAENAVAGVFSPRSGEIFQTTKEGPGPATFIPWDWFASEQAEIFAGGFAFA